jgi:hypothetical protein
LEGCPLAYQANSEVEITAYVDHQPSVNVGFVHRDVVQSTPGGNVSHRQGTYSGLPVFQRHFGWAHNLNSPNAMTLPAICLPTISARAAQDLSTLADSL